MHKVSLMKTAFSRVRGKEAECPAQKPVLNPTTHLWDELEPHCVPGLLTQSSLPDLIKAFVAEKAQLSQQLHFNT